MAYIAMLAVSRHAQERMQQRGYTQRDLDLVVCYGTPVADGYLLTRDGARELAAIPGLRQKSDGLLGTAVIAQDGTIITVFRADKACRRRLTKSDQRRHRKG